MNSYALLAMIDTICKVKETLNVQTPDCQCRNPKPVLMLQSSILYGSISSQ